MKRREVAVLSKGDCFGEIALFFGSTRTATVVAETECDLLMLDR
jgi:CRP-like cAMP-binding protein